jgi:cysteine-rich repeat protein
MQLKSSGFVWAVLLPAAVAMSVTSCAASTSDDAEQSVAANSADPLCGNGVRDPGEQCDDGNTTNLDGCSATCGFEQIQRMNSMQMMFTTDSLCAANALGGAVGSQAQSQLQNALSGAVTDGTINVLFHVDGLTDLTGQNGTDLSLGSFVGTPANGVHPGLDAWYTVKQSALTVAGTSATTLPGGITNGNLTAGPGNVSFALALGGAGGEVDLSNTRAKLAIGSSSTPTVSTGSSPGHVASENLDPSLKSFASASGGQLCGNVSAGSLANIPAPSQLTSGSTSCSQGYTSANSLLDIFVGGCRVFIVNALSATQPDKTNDGVTAVGAGGPYKLVADGNHHVSSCKDKSGASVDLAACLKASAYSAGFKFTTQRVIVKGTTP